MDRSRLRKATLIAAAAALLLFLAVFLESRTYRVEADLSNLEDCITDFYNRGFTAEYAPILRLYDSLTFGRETILLLELDGSLGRVLLEENPFGGYKIEALSYGGGSFRYGMREYDGGKYLLFGGRNPLEEIAGADVVVGGAVYHLDIPSDPQFLVCTQIFQPGWDGTVDLDKLTLYDAQGTDITERYDLSGGRL